MQRMFFAVVTELGEGELLRRVYFVSVRNVILVFAHRTDKGYQ